LTKQQGRYQIQVNSKEEAIAEFKRSHLLDCWISAYPHPLPVNFDGIITQTPNFFMPDLDRKHFKSDKELEQVLQITLRNTDTILKGAKPTVIWTGGGYHIWQPLQSDIIIEAQQIFKQFINSTFIDQSLSNTFLSYADNLVSDYMSDRVHNRSATFTNYLTRVPNSYNSKYVQRDGSGRIIFVKNDLGQLIYHPQSKVRIIHQWNGLKPNIRYLLGRFYEYLIGLQTEEAANKWRKEERRAFFKHLVRPQNQKRCTGNTNHMDRPTAQQRYRRL
jgi:hypothetical protein